MLRSHQTLLALCTAVFLLASQFELVLSARSGGGGGGRGGGSGGGGGGGRSRNSYASSSSSSSQYGSSGGSGGSARRVQSGSGARASAPSPNSGSQWGSSAPSGAGRATGGNARPNYGTAGSSAARSTNNRPTANAPQPSQSIPVQATYNTHTTINNYGMGGIGGGRSGFGTGSLLLAGAGGVVGGYLLGSMIASSVYRDRSGCCYGCYGCTYYGPPPPYYYDSYVPYRYRYLNQSTAVTAVAPTAGGTTTTTAPLKPVDLCTLARWNMELPFTELPNMLLTFLANDNVSGVSIPEKGNFLSMFFNTTSAPYGSLNATSNVFTIPATYDLKICNFGLSQQRTATASSDLSVSDSSMIGNKSSTATTAPPMWYGGVLSQWRDMVRKGDRSICVVASFAHIPECETLSGSGKSKTEEPFLTAVKHVVELYSNASSDQQMITDLVTSTKHCYPDNAVPPKEIRSCLDFSISSDQVTSLQNQSSIFDNEEICRKYLTPDITKCVTPGSTFPCTIADLVNLNVFARNYYLCDEPVDRSLIEALQNRLLERLSSDRLPAGPTGTITTSQLSGAEITQRVSGSAPTQSNTLSGLLVTTMLAYILHLN